MERLTREQWERAQAAFYPFVAAFQLSLNPDDIDEIIYAVLVNVDSDLTPDAIRAQVQEQIQTYLADMQKMYTAMGRETTPSPSPDAPDVVDSQQQPHVTLHKHCTRRAVKVA